MTRPSARLLSAYRPPTSYPVSLAADEVAAWLNGYFALWHPAVLARIDGPPRVDGVYDHDQPGDGFIYCVPLGTDVPHDWPDRVAAVGGTTFRATPDRAETLADLPAVADEVRLAFAGVGYGYLVVDTLFDAAGHDRLLDAEGFWADVTAAVAGDPLTHLKAAAEKLKDARDRLTTNDLWLVEFHARTEPFPHLQSGDEKCAAAVFDRPDDLLPVESQLWNLLAARKHGVETAAWQRPTAHPLTPGLLLHAGFRRTVFLPAEGGRLPDRRTAVVTWPGLDGKTVEGFAREPLPADSPLTFFNLAHHLHEANTSDHKAVVALKHGGEPAVGYAELRALERLAPAAGAFTSIGAYLDQSHYGDYLGAANPDDFFGDHLRGPDPVSSVAGFHRRRRAYDTALSLAALYRSLTPPRAGDGVEELLAAEEGVERGGGFDPMPWAKTLADRIQASAPARPGWLVFNPCGFARRVPLELDAPVPVGDAVKASEWVNGVDRVVVEVPGLGYAWLPRGGNPPPPSKLKSAEATLVRNEFLEAELDPATGGLRAFRDARTRMNRLGVQFVGGTSRATVKVTHAGAALGEVTADGELLAPDGRRLATFRHRLRAWAGRPAVEGLLEFAHVEPPSGDPWDHYFGLRFGWRDERAALYRGCSGASLATRADRFHAPDFLEVRLGGERTFVFPGGLPFWKKTGPRTADLILIPPGETCRRFEYLLAVDREVPMQTAQGWVTPAPLVATDKGPPGGAASGWLGHVDLPSLLLTSLRPDGAGAVARLQEVSGFGGAAELLFARPVAGASQIDGEGGLVQPLTPAGGAVPVEFSANELLRVRCEWPA